MERFVDAIGRFVVVPRRIEFAVLVGVGVVEIVVAIVVADVEIVVFLVVIVRLGVVSMGAIYVFVFSVVG